MPTTEFASAGNYPAGSDPWSGQPRKTVFTGSERAQGFTPDTPITADVLNGLLALIDQRLAAGVPDLQTITVNGTWTKPTDALLVHIKMIGRGGNGGAGHATGNGGGGGGSGEIRELVLPASDLPATLTATITGLVDYLGNTGMVRLSGTGVQLDARPGLSGFPGTATLGGGGGALIPDGNDGLAGVAGSGSAGGDGGGVSSWSSGGGGGGDNTFSGGAGGRGDCNAGRAGGGSGVGGLGGRGYGAGGGGGGGGAADGGGGGGGGSGIGPALFAASGGLGGAGLATYGSTGVDGVIIVTTWRGIP